MEQTVVHTSLERADSPESLGIPSQAILDFIDDAEKSGVELHSFMILRHGRVAAEAWWKPFSPDMPHTMFSHSKSVAATAVGFAIDEGLLSLDTNVYSLFPEQAPANPSPNARALTVRHLLTMTSGKLDNPTLYLRRHADWVADYLRFPFVCKPGTRFIYTSANTYMLCAIVAKVTGMSVVDYLTPRLFEPLGIATPFWETDENGVETGGWGLQFTTEDQAKFIQCYLDHGMWAGKQVIPGDWVEQATAKQVENTPGVLDNCVGYGYQFWRNHIEDSFRCDGLYSQLSLALQRFDACIVVNGGAPLEADTMALIWRHFPAAFHFEVMPENPEALAALQARVEGLHMPDLPVGHRKTETEQAVENHTIRTRARRFASILGAPNLFLLAHKPGHMDQMKFNFHDRALDFSWTEDSGVNTIQAGLDGRYRYSTMRLGDMKLHTASKAAWQEDGTLEIWVRPLELVQIRKMNFKFANGRVRVHSRAEQALADLAVFWVGFIGLDVNDFLKGLIKVVVHVVSPIIDPDFKGKFID